MDNADVVVIGGGPAGCSTEIWALTGLVTMWCFATRRSSRVIRFVVSSSAQQQTQYYPGWGFGSHRGFETQKD
ncbi:MAG: hypothetical protein Ct9H300mP23_01320 [Nitrospinota bacterium]|nr:MAG: hypothetical protein Ct9H300mP23_01320 [Nitrospinota bacterium]